MRRAVAVGLYAFIFLLFISLFIFENVNSRIRIEETGFNIKKYLENPELYGNHQAERMGKIVNISNDHFYFEWAYDVIVKIYGSGVKQPILGETIVYLDYRKDGKIHLIDYHNYNYNQILYVLSFIAVVIFIAIFFQEWKLTRRGFENA